MTASPGSVHERFVWAVATGGYRVEGGVREGGRGAGIWDLFAHTPGRVANGATGDVAADQLRRFDDDVALAADLGVAAVRLSVSWARIVPDGRGRPNREGLDLYERRIDSLLAADLDPWLCPYHFDLPETLQELGGWTERDTVHRFNDYVATLLERLGDRVARVTLVHEPNTVAHLGHLRGVHAPGLRDTEAFAATLHHLALAVRLTGERLRGMGGWSLAASLRARPVVPVDAERDEDIEAVERYLDLWRGAALAPLIDRRYPEAVEPLVEPWVREGDLLREAPLDAIEVATLPTLAVRPDPSDPLGVVASRLPSDPERESEALRDLLVDLAGAVGERALTVVLGGLPIVGEALDARGELHDGARIDALAAALQGMRAAVDGGVPLGAVVVDPLLDGFEWHEGFGCPRGLVHVDRESLRRTPKGSYRWLADAIREG